MTQRRTLLLALGAGLVGHAGLPRAQTSSPALRRVAVFSPSTRANDDAIGKPFYDEMRRLGWIEGHNIAYDRVSADDRMETLPRLAAELVARKPELIFAVSSVTALAAKQASSSIPIIFAAVADPVAAGLVASLARPGGNATGVSNNIADSLAPKRLQLLLEVLPGMKRIGRLGNPSDPNTRADQAALAPLVGPLGLTMIVASATNPSELDAAVASLIEQRAQAIFPGGTISVILRERLLELAHRARIPVVGLNALMADAGALFSYGTSLADALRRMAQLGDKVLQGAKPSDIPVEAPSLFELVVNLKTAKALGITVPQSILLRADRVIE